MLTDDLQQFINRGVFPSDDEFFKLFAPSGNRFLDQEGPNWDFKREWPYSYSDAYYEGIARAVCGFGNSRGGYIVFGVHDESRRGGHNKVRINVDKLQAAIAQTLNARPSIQVRDYSSEAIGDTTCLLVLPRPQGLPPYRAMRASSYPCPIIWVRQGHEIQRADPRHIPELYFRVFDEDELSQEFLSGSLPPNPRTLKRFIGRIDAFDALFNWLFNSDEPRLFLWGKGGSGKSSIAYEFAKIVQRYGRNLRTFGGEATNGVPIDNVIFLTAKERILNPLEGEQRTTDPDFTDERSLYTAILQYGQWTSDETHLSNAAVIELRQDLIPTPDRFESHPPPANGIWIAATTSRRIQSGLEAVLRDFSTSLPTSS